MRWWLTATNNYHLNIQRGKVKWKIYKLNLHHYLANYCSHITMCNIIYNKWLLVPLTESFVGNFLALPRRSCSNNNQFRSDLFIRTLLLRSEHFQSMINDSLFLKIKRYYNFNTFEHESLQLSLFALMNSLQLCN